MEIDDVKGVIQEAFTKQGQLLKQEREEYNARIEALEKGMATSDHEEKLDRISGDLNAVTEEITKLKRSAGVGATPEKEDEIAVKAFYNAVQFKSLHSLSEHERNLFEKSQIESGKIYDPGKSDNSIKAMTSGNDFSGGLFVPVQEERNILRLVEDNTAMLRVSERKNTGTSSYTRPVRLSKASGQWVGEMEDRPKTDTPNYGEIKIDVHKIMARPLVSKDLMEDSFIDINRELTDAVTSTFTDMIGEALIHGNGIKKPQGLLSYPMAEMSTPTTKVPFGTLGFIKTGKNGGLADSAPGDVLIKTTDLLKSQYRPGAVWMMNSSTSSVIRCLKDGQGNYLWQPSFQMERPDRLLGYPIELDENMPDIGAGTVPIVFGNFRRGYLVVNRRGMMLVRDEITYPGTIIFNMDLRIGGGVQNSEAFKLVKFSA